MQTIKIINDVGFEVLRVITMNTTTFYNLMPCILIEVHSCKRM
jgi:hypothetical protein